MAKIIDPFKTSTSGIVDPFAAPAPAAPAKPAGVSAADFLRTGAGSVVSATGGLVRGAAEGLRSFGVESAATKALAGGGDAIGQAGSGLQQSVSQAASREMQGSTPEGSLADLSSITLGTAPSVTGYALNAVQGLGSTVPTLATGLATRGKLAPTAAVAASMGGGFAAQDEEQRIAEMPEAELAKLPGYIERLQTMAPVDARASLAADAANAAFRYTAPVSASDALVEVLPFTGAVQKALGRLVGAEVREAFCSHHPAALACFVPLGQGKFLADLAGLARLRLRALGVKQIYGNDSTAPWCTVGNASRFFSYRRDQLALGGSGRMAACIWRD